jgi:DNA-directed RNA polymerase specialized sigma24 family protein
LIDRDPLTRPVLTFAEIALVFGVSKQTIMEEHDRALEKLRVQLAEDFARRKARDERAEMNEG